MLPVDQAETLILEQVHPLSSTFDVDTVDLLDAAGRVLAVPVTSPLDIPHWDNSAMDGYAVRHADVADCSLSAPVSLEIVEEIPAGDQPRHTLQPGQAARILTGSMLPAGADTVVMQERTQRQGAQVTILEAPKLGAFVRKRGQFYQAGQPLLQAGTQLQAAEIAVLAATQCAQVRVFRTLEVAILSTGSELVSVDQPLQPGQIVDSNQYALATLVKQLGAEPILMGIIPDHPEVLKRAIARALTTADVVLSSGGVSVGDYDYVDQILTELGATLHLRSVAIRPGKPLTFATVQRPFDSTGRSPHTTLYFGLPGNPVSALVTFWRFVQPALRKLSGVADAWHPVFVPARLASHPAATDAPPTSLRSDGQRETYIWGQLRLDETGYEFVPAKGQHNSANLINLAGTTGLAVIPVGQTEVKQGEVIQVMRV